MSTRQVHSETRQHNSIVSEMLYAFLTDLLSKFCSRLYPFIIFHVFLHHSFYLRMDSSAAWQLFTPLHTIKECFASKVWPKFRHMQRSAQVMRFAVHAGKRAIDEAKFELSHLWRWLWRNFGDEGLFAELSRCRQAAQVQAIRFEKQSYMMYTLCDRTWCMTILCLIALFRPL